VGRAVDLVAGAALIGFGCKLAFTERR